MSRELSFHPCAVMTALLCLLTACGPASAPSPLEARLEGARPLEAPRSDRTPSWSSTAPMKQARYYHTASLLPQGQVLVTGGGPSEDSASNQTELYDPVSATWTPAAPMSRPRLGHSATVLSQGTLLVAGGWDGKDYLVSAELYDAETKTWTATASLRQARHYHTATRLNDGRVLVVGGWNDDTTLASAELYDPATGRWSVTAPLSQARDSHAAVLLPDGKVLVMGGWGTTHYLTSAEIYDPVHGRWSPAAPLHFARGYHTATSLENGQVLVAGGFDDTGLPGAAELYDPEVNHWETARPLATARYYHTATPLPDGRVLVSGGYQADHTPTASTELYDPSTGLWVPAAPLSGMRANHSATLLASGQVLVTGGKSGPVLSSAELYGLGETSEPPPSPPETWIDAAPDARTRLTGATFGFHSNEAGATFESSLDGAPFAPNRSPVSLQALTEGSHTFRVRAKGATGLVDATPATHAWTVDLTPPDTRLLSAPAARTEETTATFTFESTEAGSTFECALDGASFASCVSPSSVSGLSPGSHSFQVRARDDVGHVDESPATQAWSVLSDVTAPVPAPEARPAGCSVGAGTPCLALAWMLLVSGLTGRRRRPTREVFFKDGH